VERFIEKPYLPQRNVKSVLLGADYPQITKALTARGIKVQILPHNRDIAKPVRAHADMSAYYCGSGRLILSKSIFHSCNPDMFPSGCILECSAVGQGVKYPLDIGLNACQIGDLIFCNIEHTDATILEYANSSGKKLINVSQGYAKCSVCVLGEKHIITADKSINEAASEAGINSLLIEPGFFELPGYDYGFIGGSCFKLNKSILAFTGTLKGHENEREILEFARKCGVDITYLTSERCIDVGSIIPITERKENC